MMFIDLWRALVLGILEGATEFIPVSSIGPRHATWNALGYTVGEGNGLTPYITGAEVPRHASNDPQRFQFFNVGVTRRFHSRLGSDFSFLGR